MEKINWERWASVAVCMAAAGVAIWLGGRLIVTCLLPFFLAWGLSLGITPLAERASRRLHCSPKLCAVLLLTGTLCLAVFLIGVSVNRLLAELQGLLNRLLEQGGASEDILAGRLDFFQGVSAKIGFLNRFSENANAEAFRERFDEMVGNALAEAISSVSAALPGIAAKMFAAMPSVLLFIVVTVIAGFYFCIDRRGIESSLLSMLPKGIRDRTPAWKEKIRRISFRYLRAYLILLLLTFAELFLGLSILRVEYAFLLAAIIALVDVLPVFGVGAVLVPWAIVELIRRRFQLGIGLLILYGAVSLVHQIMEPKLVGKSLGLHPLLTLVSGYVGFRLFGVVGMAVAPLVALLLRGLRSGLKKAFSP